MLKTLSGAQTPAVLHTSNTANEEGINLLGVGGIVPDEAEDLWKEMEALEVGGASSGEEGGGG